MIALADIGFGQLLLVVVEVFLFAIWLWLLFTIVNDLFNDHAMSGWTKALWILPLVFIPFLTMLVYLVFRGAGMRERTLVAQAEAKHHLDSYVQQAAHSSPADQLHKLNDLREKGALTDAEFERAKGRLLA